MVITVLLWTFGQVQIFQARARGYWQCTAPSTVVPIYVRQGFDVAVSREEHVHGSCGIVLPCMQGSIIHYLF
jgi:hypothetical protein